MGAFAVLVSMRVNGELIPLDRFPDPFSGNNSLRDIGVEQKRGKLFTAKPGCDITCAKCVRDDLTDMLKCLAACYMAEVIIHLLEIVNIHHQHTELSGFLLCTCSFAAQFRKKRLAG